MNSFYEIKKLLEEIGVTQDHISPTNIIGWDDYFMLMCDVVALRSKDSNTKFGAVFVRDNRIIATGYNSFPADSIDNILPNNRLDGLKYKMVLHAEENAILFAAKNGISLDGCTLMCQGHPCSECCKKLISVGVKNWIIGNRPYQCDEKEVLLRNLWVKMHNVKIRCYTPKYKIKLEKIYEI